MTSKTAESILEAIIDNKNTQIELEKKGYIVPINSNIYEPINQDICNVCFDPKCYGNYTHWES